MTATARASGDEPIRVEERAGEVHVRVAEDLDLALTEPLRERVEGALAGGAPGVVVDLADCPFLDSSGVRVLVELSRACAERERPFRVVAGGQPLRVLTLTQVLELLRVSAAPGEEGA